MDKAMINCGYILCMLGAISTVCQATKITKLNVPSVYILENRENPEPLILDCEYEVGSNEKGFVLKWYLNDLRVYQWIPSNHQPHTFNAMKNHINLNYTASTEVLHKHRALSIINPTPNMTGTYTCNAGSYQSEDRQSAHLQIIVPESELQIKISEENDDYKVECSAKDVYPEPKLAILIKNEEDNEDFVIKNTRDSKNGLYDSIIFGKVKKDAIENPSDIDCLLTIAGTNYTKRKEASDLVNNSPCHYQTDATTLLLNVLAVTITLLLRNFV